MKKVLALVLAFALCFTAIAGCFAVSANAPDISIETADTSFTISGTNYAAKIAQITELTVANGLTVLSIYDGDKELVKYDPANEDDDEFDFDWVESTVEGNTVIKFLNLIEAGQGFTYTVNVDAENAAPGSYAITATIEAGDYDKGELVEVESAEATFVKEAPHVCTPGEPVVENNVPADCVNPGSYDSVIYCTGCGEEISRTPHTVEATGHTPDEAVVENNVPADCVNAGSYDTVVYCSVCDAEISRDTTTVDAKGHTAGAPVEEDGFMVTRCTVCGAELSREAIEVECQHVNKTVVSAKPATETTPGSIDFDCPDCDKDDEIDIDDVTYYMYYSSSGVSSSCDSEILLNIVARQDLLNYQGEYTDLFVYTEKDIKEEDLDNPVGDVEIEIAKVDDAIEVNLSSTIKGYQWDFGVASTELADNIMSAIFVEYNGKWYNGIIRNTTVAAYSQSLIDDPGTTDKTRKLLVDTLNYGAAAQINFEYNTENLANATLTEEQKALATSGTITTTNNSSNPFDASDKTDNVIVSAFSTSVESRVIINYTFNTVYYQGDITDLRAVFTYENMNGQTVTSEYVHKSVATEEQLKKEMYFVDGSSNITFNIAFSELNAAEMRSVVNLTIYSGDRQVSCGTDYSIESYVAREWDGANENQRNLYNEMIQYGDSALACFGA